MLPMMRQRKLSPGWWFGDDMTGFHDIDRLVDDFLGLRRWEAPAIAEKAEFVPHVDVTDCADCIRVTADLPGVEEKDVDITFHDGVLTIRGERRSETKKEEEGRRYAERVFGTFTRSMSCGPNVEQDKIEANFKNGVLTVVLPKSAEAKDRTRKIPVTHAS